MAITNAEVKKIATAIAKANKHSSPDEWADKVVFHFANPDAVEAPSEPEALPAE
jgi:hypothetical protein